MAEIVVYTSNDCPKCKELKEYLKDNELGYEERNVMEEDRYREEIIDMGYRSVPVILIDGNSFNYQTDKNLIQKILSH